MSHDAITEQILALLESSDPDVARIIRAEADRQQIAWKTAAELLAGLE